MTNEERKLFWEKLCTFPTDNPINDTKELKNLIKYPQSVYRFRKVDDRTINALEKRLLFLSSSDYFDDPLDSYISIDYDMIMDQIINGITKDKYNQRQRFLQRWSGFKGMKLTIEGVNQYFQYLEDNLEYILPEFLVFLKQRVQPSLQKCIWSVCFCENSLSSAAWLKYGDNHKGFCIGYDLDDSFRKTIGSEIQEVNNSGKISLKSLLMYPIYYSQERYDASDIACEIMQGFVFNSRMNRMVIPVGEVAKFWELPKWAIEKIALIKSIEHEQDEEWRLLYTERTEKRVHCRWNPSSIVLGLRMSREDRIKVINAAKVAGISKFYEVIINFSDRFELKDISSEV